MKQINSNNFLFFITVFIFFIINVLQGSYTELIPDEAYYWVYSLDMSWGYFDHPPLVALWVKTSSWLFNKELGVRFFASISFSLLVYLIWNLIEHPEKRKYVKLYLLLVFSTALLNAYGFITVPDTPLVLFVAIFLLGYQKYIRHKSIVSYLIILIGIVGMLYSKYQGLLVVLFVLASNLKVLKDWKMWAMTLGVIICYFPHLYWQFENDFPSIRYHLYERVSYRTYKTEYTLMHIVNIAAILGITFPFYYLAFFKSAKSKDLFLKGLNFIVAGFILFFLLISFNRRVQAQWIVPISIPLIIITFNYLVENLSVRKLFWKFATINLLLLLVIRIIMINDFVGYQFEFHGNKTWVSKLEQYLNGRTPLFENSYQNTSTYWFYSGKQPCQYNTFDGRKNQFNLSYSNKKCQEKEVVHVGRKNEKTIDSIKKRNRRILYLTPIENYRDLKKIDFVFEKENYTISSNQANKLEVTIENKYNRLIDVNSFKLFAYINDKKGKAIDTALVTTELKNPIVNSLSNVKTSLSFTIKDTIYSDEEYILQLCGINDSGMRFTRMSNNLTIKIK